MKKLLLLSILLLFLVCVAQALPNASITINRTGDIGAIPQTILITNTTTEPEQVTAYNLSLQGTGNNTVWRNDTTWTDYEYTYNLVGNFTPYLLVHYSGGTNQSQSSNVNTSYGVPTPSVSVNQSGDIGAIPQTVLFTDTSTVNSPTSVNLSLQGTGNDTVWYNQTSPASGWTYSYTYRLAGNWSPYLILTNPQATNTSGTTLVNTSWGAPVGVPGLNRTGNLGIFPQTIQYNDTSYYNVSTLIWDFGDGNITAGAYATVRNGTFTYNVPGNYTLTHYAISFEGNTSTTALMNVSHAIPTASFSCTRTDGSTNLNGTRPFTIICNDTMNNPVTAWDARDWYGTCLSTNQTTRNITMTCTFGGYKSVGMIASNEAGKSSQCRQNYIWVMKFQGQGFAPQESIWQQFLDFLHDVFGIGSG